MGSVNHQSYLPVRVESRPDGFLQVDGHQDEILSFGLAVDTMQGNETSEYEELDLAMVNETLERMNWINATE
jgi:hypothetical protein